VHVTQSAVCHPES